MQFAIIPLYHNSDERMRCIYIGHLLGSTLAFYPRTGSDIIMLWRLEVETLFYSGFVITAD